MADSKFHELPDDSAQIEARTYAAQELAQLAGIAATLAPRCRQVFTLRKVYGCSHKEIAHRLGISESAVEQDLVKAARRCADVLHPLSRRTNQKCPD